MKRDKWKRTDNLQRMRFEKLKKFVFDHPRNDSGWYELMYGYFFQGYYTEDLEDFLLSDDIDIIRGTLTAMLETYYKFSPLNILIEKLNIITEPDIICKILLNIEQNIDEHNGLEVVALILKQINNDSIFVKKTVLQIINRLPSSIVQAIMGKRYENLPIIHELGHTVEKYGGEAFRSVVRDENYDAIDFFIAHNVDINYNKADMVYPFKPTPLCVAARYVNLKMCKYLVEKGADVTIAEKDGMRPYSIAIEKGDQEMALYFKSLEPKEFHDLNNKLDELRPYKLSKSLIDFLQGENLHINLPDSSFGFIEFFSLLDIVPFKVGKQKLLRLSKMTGDYPDTIIVWNPKSKKIAYYDIEHEKLKDLCTFEEFLDSPDEQLEKCFN